MTPWHVRIMLRAFAGACLALVLAWLVSAATDEGQLAFGVRVGRTLPLAPLCSAVGVALTIAGARAREEFAALEASGAPSTRSALWAVAGATLPTMVVALVLGVTTVIDVRPFYPQPVIAETFQATLEGGFESRSLGIAVDASGGMEPLTEPQRPREPLPRLAREAAGLTTAAAGLAFSLSVALSSIRRTPMDESKERRRRGRAFIEGILVAALTLVAFQWSSVRETSPMMATVPSVTLLALSIARTWRDLR